MTVEPEKEAAYGGAASADHDGFTDSKGRRMTFEAGIRNAARCIRDQGEIDVIEELIRWNMAPDEILVWLVYPESGEFADTYGIQAADSTEGGPPDVLEGGAG